MIKFLTHREMMVSKFKAERKSLFERWSGGQRKSTRKSERKCVFVDDGIKKVHVPLNA